MAQPELATGPGVNRRAIAGTVVAHHPLDGDPHGAKPLAGAPDKARGRLPTLIAQDLGVGEAGGIVDADVDELPAGSAQKAPMVADPGTVGPDPAVAGHPVAGNDDPPELLDVDVD